MNRVNGERRRRRGPTAPHARKRILFARRAREPLAPPLTSRVRRQEQVPLHGLGARARLLDARRVARHLRVAHVALHDVAHPRHRRHVVADVLPRPGVVRADAVLVEEVLVAAAARVVEAAALARDQLVHVRELAHRRSRPSLARVAPLRLCVIRKRARARLLRSGARRLVEEADVPVHLGPARQNAHGEDARHQHERDQVLQVEAPAAPAARGQPGRHWR